MIKKIINTLQLGILLENPIKVVGGLTHTTYKVCTDNGTYIIKLLNPSIMKRDTALANFQNADKLEKILKENNIKILGAKQFGNSTMQKIDDQYFYIFDYYEGASLKSNQIKIEHCKLIALELANIHKIDMKQEKYDRKEIHVDWDFYIDLAKAKNKTIYDKLINSIDAINESMNKGNQAIKSVPNVISICHNDMDSKNVLWNNDEFKIIDLECLGYSNPYIEFFQLALCWSGYEECNIKIDLLKTCISTYLDNINAINVDWESVYYSNYGRLEWLEFNLKRAFMIECDTTEEQNIGINEVIEAIEHVVYYDKSKSVILDCFYNNK